MSTSRAKLLFQLATGTGSGKFRIQKLFRLTRFGIFAVFGLIVLSTSSLTIYTVDTQLSEEYATNARNISSTIASASVDILLNQNLSSLQALIDQFIEVEGISYVYITDENGEFLAHTFVPGIPEEIRTGDHSYHDPVERTLSGMREDQTGDFIEVGSPILAGYGGTVHVGTNLQLVNQKVTRAIGQQVWLVCIILFVGIFASIFFVNLAARPLAELLAYAVELARGQAEDPHADGTDGTGSAPIDREFPGESVLARDDEVGTLARLFLHFRRLTQQPGQ